jgi:hypothetical protein
MMVITRSMWSSAFFQTEQNVLTLFGATQVVLSSTDERPLPGELTNSLKILLSERVCGIPSTSATKLKWKALFKLCVLVQIVQYLSAGGLPFLRSMTTRISLVDSSRRPLIPSNFFSWTSSAIATTRFCLLTRYGMEVMTI